MVGTKVLCINDSSRPNEIPLSKWVKKGTIYTVRQFDKLKIQGNVYGFKLKEISIDDCFPYTHYAANRFVPLIEITKEEFEEQLELEEA